MPVEDFYVIHFTTDIWPLSDVTLLEAVKYFSPFTKTCSNNQSYSRMQRHTWNKAFSIHGTVQNTDAALEKRSPNEAHIFFSLSLI